MSISRNEAYELIAACEQAGLSRQKTKDLLNNQGYPINSKQLVCAMSKPESTEGRPLGQPLKKLLGAPLNLG